MPNPITRIMVPLALAAPLPSRSNRGCERATRVPNIRWAAIRTAPPDISAMPKASLVAIDASPASAYILRR